MPILRLAAAPIAPGRSTRCSNPASGCRSSSAKRPTPGRIMATAHNYSLPVPKAYYLLEDEDGLGAGFVMERIDGETISRKSSAIRRLYRRIAGNRPRRVWVSRPGLGGQGSPHGSSSPCSGSGSMTTKNPTRRLNWASVGSNSTCPNPAASSPCRGISAMVTLLWDPKAFARFWIGNWPTWAAPNI